MPTLPPRRDLTVCLVSRDDTDPIERVLAGLRRQNTAGDTFDVVVVDATTDGRHASLATDSAPPVQVVRAAPTAARSELLNTAWRSATAEAVAFLSPQLVPAPAWVEALTRALQRGRRVVTASWLPSTETVADSGTLSHLLWANRWEAPIVSADQIAFLRADVERVSGWTSEVDDDKADVDLVLRLIEAGADPYGARHAVAFYDVTAASASQILAQRRQPLAAQPLLVAHPRAKARLLFGGVFWHRRHAELLLLAAGLALAPRNRRALALTIPWLHERTCLTPAAGGTRRRWFVLPGVFAVDAYDVAISTAARLRGWRSR
jgi:hypothetical protein